MFKLNFLQIKSERGSNPCKQMEITHSLGGFFPSQLEQALTQNNQIVLKSNQKGEVIMYTREITHSSVLEVNWCKHLYKIIKLC